MDEKSRTATSKFLSYVLRHEPAAISVALDSGGWVAVDVLLREAVAHFLGMLEEDLVRYVLHNFVGLI